MSFYDDLNGHQSAVLFNCPNNGVENPGGRIKCGVADYLDTVGKTTDLVVTLKKSNINANRFGSVLKNSLGLCCECVNNYGLCTIMVYLINRF